MRISVAVFLGALALLSACASGIVAVEPANLGRDPPLWKSMSVGELYIVSVRPDAGTIPIGKMHRWIINVSTTEGAAVYPASISIGGGMQGHGHGLPTQPRVIAYGGIGDYLIDGVRFNMEGEWRLSFVIDSEHGSDQVDFEIDVSF